MKRIITGFLITIMLVLVMTGCGESTIPELKDDELKAIGEYTAFTIMKYDANHRSRLVELKEESPSEEMEAEAPDLEQMPEESKQVGMDPTEDTPIVGENNATVSYNNIEEALGLPDGLTLVYKGEYFCTTYPEDSGKDMFSVTASKGNQLLILSFDVLNSSNDILMIDIYDRNISAQADINDSIKRWSMQTMLLDDLATAKESIESGQTKEFVLLFEVDESMDSINSLKLNLKNESIKYTIHIK